ncbi:unnamed protein product [Allacma fusca]|uniref:Uncharacterized protein n=1 Tax=Allacma fusca TaxID=39272 RepID=A0A8J2KLT2_9HEXA|nr:unnamed protein product [Allacma fusca]
MAHKRLKSDPQRGFPNPSDIAEAVSLIVDKKLDEIKETINDLSAKVESSCAALQGLETKYGEIVHAIQAQGHDFPMDQLMPIMDAAFGKMVEELKTTFLQAIGECERTRHASRTATTGTTAEAETVRVLAWNLDSIQENSRSIVESIVHNHNEFLVFRTENYDSDVDASGDDGDAEAVPKVVVPAKTLAIELAIVNKRQPLSSIVQRTDPQTYVRLVSDRQKEIRKSASRIFQYFRSRYDLNGEMIPTKRTGKKNASSPKGVPQPGVSSNQHV